MLHAQCQAKITIRQPRCFQSEKFIRGEPVESCKLRYFNSFEFFDHTGFGTLLLQRRVLRLGLSEDWDVGIGVFPEGEEVLVFGAGFGGVTLQGISTGETEMCERTKRVV
jgi:hypothetical protein